MQKLSKIIILSFFLIIILVLVPQTIASSKTIYVKEDGTKDYTSIQEAINVAETGDTIYAYSGTYAERVIINKSINLIGEDKNTTIINANYSGNALYISVDNVKISGFTIQNSGHDSDAAGIEIHSDYNSITNNTIRNNWKGIYLRNSSNGNIIYHNNIINNTQNANATGNNTWHDAILEEGNYWDDYNGTDANDDGIGDTPYNISEGNNQDLSPLMKPYEGKLLEKPDTGIDTSFMYPMMIIGLIISIIFCIPIAIYWRKKYYS